MAGIFLGQSRKLSSHLAVTGGILLFAIALFLVIPEVATRIGWTLAVMFSVAVCCGLVLLDRWLARGNHSPADVIGPLLAATAVHSLLDGWGVRVLSAQELTSIAVPLGLALHKLPEGLALGLITRRSMSPAGKALLASGAVEGFTVIGALIEPRADQLGATRFGDWWMGIVLAIIAGSFLFVGFHSVAPSRHNSRI